MHGCVYCYAKGYSEYPGDERVVVYSDTVEKITSELLRKRKKPVSVYFSPSSDAFQAIPELLGVTFEAMKKILSFGIGVEFLTKGVVPVNFLELFAKTPGLVFGQIGIDTVNENMRKILEPGTPSVKAKLATLQSLASIGVDTSVRVDPLVYGLTDSDEDISKLFESISGAGCEMAAVSYFYLRAAIEKSFAKHITNKSLLARILQPYANGELIAFGMQQSRIKVLPRAIREVSYDRIANIASEYGVEVKVCGCKNADVTRHKCSITRAPKPVQGRLF